MAQVVETSYNNAHAAAAAAQGVLQIRLDTTSIIENIELFLKGYMIEITRDSDSGQVYATQKPINPEQPEACAFANPQGRQAILSLIQSMVNSQVVQGNTDDLRYTEFLVNFHESLASNIIENCYNWEIDDSKLNFLIDFIMQMVELFLTRTLGNEERLSYAATLKTTETLVKDQKRSMFGGVSQ